MEEAIAIQFQRRQKTIRITESLFHITDPSKYNQLLKTYRGLMFPEQRYDDLKELAKGREFFEKIRNLKFEMRLAK